jgi:hypothetical protein
LVGRAHRLARFGGQFRATLCDGEVVRVARRWPLKPSGERERPAMHVCTLVQHDAETQSGVQGRDARVRVDVPRCSIPVKCVRDLEPEE